MSGFQINLPETSADYDVVDEAVRESSKVPGLVCEIGLFRGGGAKHLIDGIADSGSRKTLVTIDPYGNIEYVGSDVQGLVRLDFWNSRRNDCMVNLFAYAQVRDVNLLFFNLEDTEFFNRFGDGVPIYEDFKRIEDQYSCVHFDGPHTTDAVLHEFDFFNKRASKGAWFAFDDVDWAYDHENIVHPVIVAAGWESRTRRGRHWSYEKV